MSRLVLLATMLVGCASNDDIPPTSLEYDDLALSVGSTVAQQSGGGEMGAFGDVVALARGQVPAGFKAAADGSITGSHAGLGYSYRLVCSNAQGVTAPCDGSTDGVVAQVSWTGALDLPDTGMQFQRTGPWTLSGMAQGVATASGTATLVYDSRITNPDRGSTSTYHLAYDATYDNVAYDMSAKLPLAGDITYAISADRHETDSNTDSARHYDVTAAISIIGDGTATIDLDDGYRYKLTLATATVVRI